MKITRFEIFSYRLPLCRPLMIKKNRITTRQGLIIKLTGEKNVFGYGEISPLPGFSREDIKTCRTQIIQLKKYLTNSTLSDGADALPLQLKSLLGKFHLCPSVQCGMEMAIVNLLANSRKILPCKLLNPSCPKTLLISGLLQGSLNEMTMQAKDLIKKGYKVLKLKLGNDNSTTDIQKVNAIRSIIANRATLRLDANQAWSLRDAIKFGRTIGMERIDYIEEPLKDPSQLNKFFYETYIPIALDESLGRISAKKIQKIDGLKAFVIKPTQIGGIGKSMELISLARNLGIGVVMSSLFETGIGLSFLANCHVAYASSSLAAGLDTIKWFKKDLLLKSAQFHNPRWNLQSLFMIQNALNLALFKPMDNA